MIFNYINMRWSVGTKFNLFHTLLRRNNFHQQPGLDYHCLKSDNCQNRSSALEMATKIMKRLYLSAKSNTRLHYMIFLSRTELTVFSGCIFNKKVNVNMMKRYFSTSHCFCGSAGHAETTSTTQGLSKLQAQELVLRLNGEERNILISVLQEYQSKLVKDEYEGQLAASRWRSKFGRPSKLPRLGDVDPTGSYCPVPEDWLLKKCAESVPRPSNRNLVDIGIANSIPFIGFGFLDNFFMLLFGDYIDVYLGSYFCMTTMAAAALGNTFSDVLGIGTAFYVERLANKIGYSPPKLSPLQMDMSCSRNAANCGRVLGVTIGCILGMFPLLFRRSKDDDEQIINNK